MPGRSAFLVANGFTGRMLTVSPARFREPKHRQKNRIRNSDTCACSAVDGSNRSLRPRQKKFPQALQSGFIPGSTALDLSVVSPGICKARGRKGRRSRKRLVAFEHMRSNFDALPDAAVDGIIRFLSESPRHPDWSCKVPTTTVLSLIRCGGSLGRVSKTAFNTVQFNNRTLCSWGKSDDDWEGKGVQVCGKYKEISHLTQAIPTQLAHELQTLFMRTPLSSTFAHAISKHCTRIRSLTVSPIYGGRFPTASFMTITAAGGSVLESLSVANLPATERIIESPQVVKSFVICSFSNLMYLYHALLYGIHSETNSVTLSFAVDLQPSSCTLQYTRRLSQDFALYIELPGQTDHEGQGDFPTLRP